MLHRKCRRCPARDEKIDIGVDETRRKLWQLFVLFCPPLLDDQVLPIDVPELTEPLNEYPEILAWSGADGKKADAGDLVGRLGAGHPHKRTNTSAMAKLKTVRLIRSPPRRHKVREHGTLRPPHCMASSAIMVACSSGWAFYLLSPERFLGLSERLPSAYRGMRRSPTVRKGRAVCPGLAEARAASSQRARRLGWATAVRPGWP